MSHKTERPIAAPKGSDGPKPSELLCHHRWEKVNSFAVCTTSATAIVKPPPGAPTISLFACIFCREERVLMDPPNTDSATPASKATELREAFAAMEQEQWDEYQDYIKRCGGVPISKIEASRPVRQNTKASDGAPT